MKNMYNYTKGFTGLAGPERKNPQWQSAPQRAGRSSMEAAEEEGSRMRHQSKV